VWSRTIRARNHRQVGARRRQIESAGAEISAAAMPPSFIENSFQLAAALRRAAPRQSVRVAAGGRLRKAAQGFVLLFISPRLP